MTGRAGTSPATPNRGELQAATATGTAASSISTGTGARRMSRTGQCASTTALSFANSSLLAELFSVTVPRTPVKPGTHPFVDGEKSPQVENAIKLDRDAVERDAKRRRISAVRDLLACRQSRQDQLHRIRASIRAAESRRLVHRQGELANPGLASEVLHLPGIDRKDRFCVGASARRLACVSTMISLSAIPVSRSV